MVSYKPGWTEAQRSDRAVDQTFFFFFFFFGCWGFFFSGQVSNSIAMRLGLGQNDQWEFKSYGGGGGGGEGGVYQRACIVSHARRGGADFTTRSAHSFAVYTKDGWL